MPQNIGIEIFANWQTLVLALGIFVITYIIRLSVQTFWRTWKENRIYNELVLHALPIVIALVVALLAKKYPWPNEALVTSASARIFYATFVGMACGIFYGRVRAIIGMVNLGVKLPEANDVVPDMPTSDEGAAAKSPEAKKP
jgi:protein-S-isoprenylcysteine O-methyltransferase Ste14